MVKTIAKSSARRETASLILQALVMKVSKRVSTPGEDHPLLNPTIFVPLKRGGNLTFQDVIASRV